MKSGGERSHPTDGERGDCQSDGIDDGVGEPASKTESAPRDDGGVRRGTEEDEDATAVPAASRTASLVPRYAAPVRRVRGDVAAGVVGPVRT